ncbi:MAG: SRPBCC family protein [Rhizobiales bacterium]|nr:SRPBCC family protein [Hyphomicrobiales bacterium]
MIHHEKSLIIEATREEVWAVVGRFMHVDEFAPFIKSVEALTDGTDGVGSIRRCHFEDGSSMLEEVTEWEANQSFQVSLSELEPMPLIKSDADISLKSVNNNQTKVTWGMDYQVKYSIFGWLLGQTMMKLMMGKILNANLKGLAEKVKLNKAAAA